MTDHIYGEESIKIKQTAKTDWVRSGIQGAGEVPQKLLWYNFS